MVLLILLSFGPAFRSIAGNTVTPSITATKFLTLRVTVGADTFEVSGISGSPVIFRHAYRQVKVIPFITGDSIAVSISSPTRMDNSSGTGALLESKLFNLSTPQVQSPVVTHFLGITSITLVHIEEKDGLNREHGGLGTCCVECKGIEVCGCAVIAPCGSCCAGDCC